MPYELGAALRTNLFTDPYCRDETYSEIGTNGGAQTTGTVIANASGTGFRITAPASSPWRSPLRHCALTPNTTYTVRFLITSSATQDIALVFRPSTTLGTTGSVTIGSVSVTASVPLEYVASFTTLATTIPAGAAGVSIVDTTFTTNSVVTIDGVVIRQGAFTAAEMQPFDGDTQATSDRTYSWTGAPYASTSVEWELLWVEPPAPEIVSPWLGLHHTMTGSNGEAVDLSETENGVVLINADVVGMGAPAYEVHRSSGPALAGSRYRGTRVLERAVELAFLVYDDDDTAGFLETDRWLWDLIGDPTQPVVWRVETPDGQWRELTMRFSEDASGGFVRDPLYDGWTLYQLRFIADDPYWYGATVSLTFLPVEASDFFIAAPDPGDMFYISQAMTTADVEIPNPGDVAGWITWTIQGALENLDLVMSAPGMTDGELGMPDVLAGDTLVTNTDPRVATALLDGVDITEAVNPWDPRPVPAKGTQSLMVGAVITGDGFLRAEIRPRYRRAW